MYIAVGSESSVVMNSACQAVGTFVLNMHSVMQV